jgi:tetratricopeptide (TPR) repeat protein
METLYDLLGALPRDDAEELRAAFRRAVKGAHPDLNPGDPAAGQKFREIVRANDILVDEEQRAAYDHLLDLAHKEQRQKSTAKAVHKAATSVIALSVASCLGLGGFLIYQNEPQFSDTLRHLTELAIARPGDFAGLAPSAQAKTPSAQARMQPPPVNEARTETPQLDIKVVQTISVQPPAAEKQETASLPPAAIVPVGAPAQAEADNTATASVGPPLEIAPSDAKVFRERGIFAYRSGNLDGAIAEFDRAIQLDPKFSAAYIDRGIVLYRLQKFERAFADIAQAKRIEKANRSKAALPATATGRKPRSQAAVALGFSPLFQRRTAKLE